MRRVISRIFILVGLILIVYPKTMEFYYDVQQEKIVKEWEVSLETIKGGEEKSKNENIQSQPKEDIDSEILILKKKAQKVTLERQEKAKKEELERKEKVKKEALKKQREAYIKKHMEGMLRIEKINLKQPILKGATSKHLNISIASIENTGKIGEIGNYCIAGHRSHTYGRNFNRLDELEIGDVVKVNDGESEYTYMVYDKFLVTPEEVVVLNGNNQDKEITLITCHPMKNPTHRLIIKGKIIE